MSHPKVADLEAALEVLASAGVEFVVVGGVAAVLHGAPVTTLDLDIVHDQTDENVDRLLGVLRGLHAEMRSVGDKITSRPTRDMLLGGGQLKLSTELGPLDVLCRLHTGEGYRELSETAVFKGDERLTVRVIDLETLIRIKSTTGRIKDKMIVPVLMALRASKQESP